jgi:DNA-binding NarL/FixJ family response regulator
MVERHWKTELSALVADRPGVGESEAQEEARSDDRKSKGVNLLSRREREVLNLIVRGKTDRQIAEDLFISRITVSNHVVHILDKLGVPNRTAAAMVATASRIVPFSPN